MSATQATESLVSKLPQRLRNFFARYPPQIYSALVAPKPTPPPGYLEANKQASSSSSSSDGESTTLPSPYTPDRDAKGAKRQDPTAWSLSKALLYSNPDYPNPFLPRKNPRTGKWMGARIGLRRQAELVKLAKQYGVEPLLPPGKKSTEYKEARRMERGLQIKGTGIGQKVKGHKWERELETKLEERRKAMLEMPFLIREWKQVRSLPAAVCCYKQLNLVQNLLTLEKNREVTEEAGRSGPNGNRNGPSLAGLYVRRRQQQGRLFLFLSGFDAIPLRRTFTMAHYGVYDVQCKLLSQLYVPIGVNAYIYSEASSPSSKDMFPCSRDQRLGSKYGIVVCSPCENTIEAYTSVLMS